MARDVEVDVNANDKTGPGLDSAAKKFAETQRKIEAQQKRSMQSFQKSAGSIVGEGGKLGALFGNSFAQGLSKAAPAAVPVLAGVAIAAAPVIGATLGAAVIGGAAGVGIVGGIVLAAKDPRVASAYSALGQSLQSSLKFQAQPFIAPLLQGATLIRQRYNESASDIGRIFANTSRYVGPLLDGASRGVQRIIEAISALSAKAGPVVGALSEGIANTLNAVADGMEKLEDNGVEAAVALRQTFQLVEVAVRGIFNTINLLTESYGILARLGAFGRDAQQQMFILDANAKIAAGSVTQVGTSMQAATPPAATYAEVLDKMASNARDLVNANRELYGSNTAVAASMAEASKTISENGRTLSANTVKGRENREALVSLASTLQSNYDAYVKVNGAGAAATARGEQLRASFVKTATAATGSARKANQLADSILGIPASRKTRIQLDHEAAMARARAVRAQIRQIPTQWRTTVNIAASVTGSSASRSALNAALGKQSLRFDASSYWQARTMGGGTSRTGGAQPVNVNATVENVVNLDGRPFRAWTDQRVGESERRQQWRRRVGGRYSNA